MIDIYLRSVKDILFDRLCFIIPRQVSPTTVTVLGFLSGVVSCYHASQGYAAAACTFWFINRCLDCLDGALARSRNQQSEFGGFLDLLCDFIIYSAIPICCGLASSTLRHEKHEVERLWLAIAVVEVTFHINNFVLFYVAAMIEKLKTQASIRGQKQVPNETQLVKELTSLSLRPALVEGFESGIAFTIMLAQSSVTEGVCWTMALGVIFGILQRGWWLHSVLSRLETKQAESTRTDS